MSNSMAKIKISMNLILFDCNVMYFWIALCCAVLCCTVLYCIVYYCMVSLCVKIVFKLLHILSRLFYLQLKVFVARLSVVPCHHLFTSCSFVCVTSLYRHVMCCIVRPYTLQYVSYFTFHIY